MRASADLRLPPVDGCACYECDGRPMMRMRMYLCPSCGNKRCPHATDHRFACTGSNEPDQIGSDYGFVCTEAEKVARVRVRAESIHLKAIEVSR